MPNVKGALSLNPSIRSQSAFTAGFKNPSQGWVEHKRYPVGDQPLPFEVIPAFVNSVDASFP